MPPYTASSSSSGINIILAVSLNLINGFTGQFSIGHAGFMAIGAYASAYFTVYHGRLRSSCSAGSARRRVGLIVFLVAILIGGLVAAFAGLLVGLPSLRLRGDYLAIVTLGFAEIIRIVILNIDVVGGATGFTGIPGYGQFLLGLHRWPSLIIARRAEHRPLRHGRAFLSVREDEIAAEAMGVNTTRYKVLAFVIGSAFAGIAGGLFAHYDKFLARQRLHVHAVVRDRHHGRAGRDGLDHRLHPRRHRHHLPARALRRLPRSAASTSQTAGS